MFLTNNHYSLRESSANDPVWGKKGTFKVANLARTFRNDRGMKSLPLDTYLCRKSYYQNNLKMILPEQMHNLINPQNEVGWFCG